MLLPNSLGNIRLDTIDILNIISEPADCVITLVDVLLDGIETLFLTLILELIPCQNRMLLVTPIWFRRLYSLTASPFST